MCGSWQSCPAGPASFGAALSYSDPLKSQHLHRRCWGSQEGTNAPCIFHLDRCPSPGADPPLWPVSLSQYIRECFRADSTQKSADALDFRQEACVEIARIIFMTRVIPAVQ